MPLRPVYKQIYWNMINETLLRSSVVTDVVNTTTGTFLGGFYVPAGYLQTDRMVQWDIIGDYLNNSGASRILTLTVLYGNSNLWQDSTLTMAASATRRAWVMNLTLLANGSATSQKGGGILLIGGTGGAATGQGDAGAAGHLSVPINFATTSENSSTELLFYLLANHPVANASLSVRSLAQKAVLL